MTSKNNRVTPLWHFKPCASFRSHLWIQTGVAVRKRPNWCESCFDLCDFDLSHLTLTFSMDITSVSGNNSWNFQDDKMTRTLSKTCEGQADEQMDRQKEVFCLVAAKTFYWSDIWDAMTLIWRNYNDPKYFGQHFQLRTNIITNYGDSETNNIYL